MICRKVASGPEPEVVGGLLEQISHAYEPGPDDEHGYRGVEHNLTKQDGGSPQPWERGEVVMYLHEEDQRGHRNDDLGYDEGQVYQCVERRSQARLHPSQGQGCAQSQNGGDGGGFGGDLEARDDRRNESRVVQAGAEPAGCKAVPDRNVADLGRRDAADWSHGRWRERWRPAC